MSLADGIKANLEVVLDEVCRELPKRGRPRGSQGKGPTLSCLEEARRIIEEYAASLREIIKQLRRKMN
ncbi:hypothetical protein ACVWYQ_006693 [Bradyrhizobium sp. USDA 3397]